MESKSVERSRMFAQIEQWQQSNLTQKAWCEKHHMRYHVFHYWYKRYRKENNTFENNASPFIQLQVKDAVPQPLMELYFGNNSRLLFYQPVASEYVKSLTV